MRLRGIFAGVIGGIILTLLLAYPIYIYLPNLIFDVWDPTQTNITFICGVLSILTLIIIGWAGGRWSGMNQSQTFLGGSAAGGIATVIAYAMIISPATGVLGNQKIFSYGLVKVPDDLSFKWLVLYGVSETIWWGIVGLWISVLFGLIFGAIGGWFAEPLPDHKDQWSKLFSIIDPLMIFMAIVNLLITYPSYKLFLEIIMRMVLETRFKNLHPINISFYLLNISSYAWVLFWQLKLWLDLRDVQKRYKIQKVSWALSSFAALTLPILLLFLDFFLMGNQIFLYITALLSIVIGILTFRDTFWMKRSLSMPLIQNPFSDFSLAIRGTLILSGFTTMTLMMGNLMIPNNIIEITIKAISPLSGYGNQTESAYRLIMNDYFLPYTLFPWIFIANFLSLLLLIWILKNIFEFLSKYALHLPEKIGRLDMD